jgi:hypothetical protein
MTIHVPSFIASYILVLLLSDCIKCNIPTQNHLPEENWSSFDGHYNESLKSHLILLLIYEYSFASTVMFSVRAKEWKGIYEIRLHS